MAQITGFIDNKKSISEKNDIIQAAVLDGAQLKTGKKKFLPEREAASTMIYTQDTGEIFIGGGGSSPIRKLSEIKTLNTINELPAAGVEDRLYVAKETGSIHYWNGTEYKTLGLAGGSGDPIAVIPRVIEFDSENDFPAKGISPAIYIARDTGVLYRYDADHGYKILCGSEVLDKMSQDLDAVKETIRNVKEMAVKKTDLDAFRKAADKITEADIDAALLEKIKVSGGKGEQGPQGQQGPKGDPGQTGPQGPQGFKGEQGNEGPTGRDGKSAFAVAVEQGFNGSETEWLASLKGDSGKDGAQGPQGLKGDKGDAGPAGPQGIQGIAGPAGKDGLDGKSAFEIAKNNGFSGTEAEWLLSLKGKDGTGNGEVVKGEKGDPGEMGPQGIQGPKGDPGEKGADGKDGIAGLQGPKGDTGAAGKDGESAYDIAKRNGFTGTESEWIASLKGKDGAQGAAGAAGQQGESAYAIAKKNGFTGTEAEWLQSIKGKDGEQGAMGAAGKDADMSKIYSKEEVDAKFISAVALVQQLDTVKASILSKETIQKMIADAIAGKKTDPEPTPVPTPTVPTDDNVVWTSADFTIPGNMGTIEMSKVLTPTQLADITDDNCAGVNADGVGRVVEIYFVGNDVKKAPTPLPMKWQDSPSSENKTFTAMINKAGFEAGVDAPYGGYSLSDSDGLTICHTNTPATYRLVRTKTPYLDTY